MVPPAHATSGPLLPRSFPVRLHTMTPNEYHAATLSSEANAPICQQCKHPLSVHTRNLNEGLDHPFQSSKPDFNIFTGQPADETACTQCECRWFVHPVQGRLA